MKHPPDDYISASEIAAFTYCPEAWRLENGLGFEPTNADSLARGERYHRRTARLERFTAVIRFIGWMLVAAAVVSAALIAFQAIR